MGFTDVTVLDVSKSALDLARQRNVPGGAISYVCANLLEWQPERRFGLWHDRAVLHFLVQPADREIYLAKLKEAVASDGAVIIGTFAEDGPEQCSGLPVARYAPEQLEAFLGNAFEVVRTCREQHTTPAGAVQSFAWVAAQCRY
jgi:hypothetical protein